LNFAVAYLKNVELESGTEQTKLVSRDCINVGLPAAGVAQMSDYRIYVIGRDGRFEKAIQLDCLDDSAAIESAKQFTDGHDIELWQRDRLIARFDPHARDIMGWLRGELNHPD
jgi:hypothetical protein